MTDQKTISELATAWHKLEEYERFLGTSKKELEEATSSVLHFVDSCSKLKKEVASLSGHHGLTIVSGDIKGIIKQIPLDIRPELVTFGKDHEMTHLLQVRSTPVAFLLNEKGAGAKMCLRINESSFSIPIPIASRRRWRAIPHLKDALWGASRRGIRVLLCGGFDIHDDWKGFDDAIMDDEKAPEVIILHLGHGKSDYISKSPREILEQCHSHYPDDLSEKTLKRIERLVTLETYRYIS